MSVSSMEQEVRAYVEAVRAHLADLPEEERADLIEDLELHLVDVAADGESLAERLGPPDAYAAELRASAGLPEPGGRARRGSRVARLRARIEASILAQLVRMLLSLPPIAAARAFLPELRAGWWVLRGYLLIAGPAILWGTTHWGRRVLPEVFGSRILGLGLILLAVWGSVALGRREPREPRARKAYRAADVTLGAMAFFVAVAIMSAQPVIAYYYDEGPSGYLQHPDGSEIVNICPYAADGSPLEDVLLFDQEGKPITTRPDPYGSHVPPVNTYPRSVREGDTTGSIGGTQRFECPEVVVARRPPAPTQEPVDGGDPTPEPSEEAPEPAEEAPDAEQQEEEEPPAGEEAPPQQTG